ncbi:MAG TPA: hypothetical protein VM432_10950 [Bdellovibrionales bacterium]|nr:hypothetical protein [Bdellovibrionales bacterium]
MRALLSLLCLSFISLLSSQASADSLSIPINASYVDSATAVVNSTTSDAHPPLQVKDWDIDIVAPFRSSPFSVGDGSDGAFKPSTYLNFHDGVYANDNIIRINTDDHPELNVTEFDLQSPWKIIPTGSKPLIIKSLSTVIIEGDIDCSGETGEDVDVSSVTVSGGIGRCGGSNGGNGGSSTVSATSGSKPSTNAFAAGGGAGASQGDGDGGGGGAGMDATTAPNSGADGGIVGGGGGSAGISDDDSEFATVGGGAGGGGGAAFTDASDAPAHSSGAGGGAGGGSIYIYSVGDILVDGLVTTDGGDGGVSAGAGRGGGGGGGAGGSILMFSGDDIVINGTITAQRGSGGISTGGDGGDGGDGRTWVIDKNSLPTLNGALDPLGLLSTWGSVTYRTGAFRIVSKTLDLESSKPLLTSADVESTVSGTSTVSVEIASADSPFTASSANWVSASSLLKKEIKRYVRIRVTINNDSETTPARASKVTLSWTPYEQSEFEFSSCGVVTTSPPSNGPGNLIAIALMLMPMIVALQLRRRKSAYQPMPR